MSDEARSEEEERDTLPPPPSWGRALVVDDQGFLRRAIARALASAGFDTVEADGGRSAIAMLDSDPSIRVVVTDLAMPDGDGMLVLRHTRATRPSVPVVLMSAYVADNAAQQARDAGAFDCLIKPFDTEDLLSVLWRAQGA